MILICRMDYIDCDARLEEALAPAPISMDSRTMDCIDYVARLNQNAMFQLSRTGEPPPPAAPAPSCTARYC